jgi:hypothetical protein
MFTLTFLLETECTLKLLNADRRIRSLQKDATGNRARDLPSLGAAAQPAAPPLVRGT